jgi:predicted ABC-type ATPase
MVEENGELVAVCPELVPDFEPERERLTASIGKLQAARSILDTITFLLPSASSIAMETFFSGTATIRLV